MKIKKILVSQPEPENGKSPYSELAKKNNLKIDFRSFIHIESVHAKEFRKTRINISDYTAVIFTSRTAIVHFFRICEEMRVAISDSMKYFCTSESTAYYLQKYIVYRKRKIFFGKSRLIDLMDVINKHKNEKYFVPVSDSHKKDISKVLDNNKINYTKAILYRTVCSDLSDLSNVNYDVLVFYSPSGIKSLFENFPDFKQNNTKIASFGPTTIKAAKDAGLNPDIVAPSPSAPSMTMALEQYIENYNKKK
ncbi:MAG: uroporphyrinogen-III synthase [Bacteroidales bacterium]|nr:uroporphyrinogen-III synthase [Bacteroidales bacterium]